jgi:hypothetical protein
VRVWMSSGPVDNSLSPVDNASQRAAGPVDN